MLGLATFVVLALFRTVGNRSMPRTVLLAYRWSLLFLGLLGKKPMANSEGVWLEDDIQWWGTVGQHWSVVAQLVGMVDMLADWV